MSDAKAGFSWTHFELMGDALSPDKWEHSTQVSMETNDVIRAQWLDAFSSKGGLGCMILNKTWPGRNKRTRSCVSWKEQLKYMLFTQ